MPQMMSLYVTIWIFSQIHMTMTPHKMCRLFVPPLLGMLNKLKHLKMPKMLIIPQCEYSNGIT